MPEKITVHKNLCIIQARMGSTRLPGKVLLKIKGKPLLEYLIKRVKLSKKIDKIVIATTTNTADDAIEALAQELGIDCFRGSENDVLDRYFQCSLKYPDYNNIVRITGDCPLIDPIVVDQVILFFEENDFDYVSNTQKETFPDGIDVEVFKRKTLEITAKEAKLNSEREHVCLYVRNNEKFKKGSFENKHNFSHFRLTVDEPEDFEVVKFVIENSRPDAGWLDYISLLTKNPEIMLKNMHITRNEGWLKSLKNDFIIKKQNL